MRVAVVKARLPEELIAAVVRGVAPSRMEREPVGDPEVVEATWAVRVMGVPGVVAVVES